MTAVTLIHGLNLAAIYGLMAIGISILWSSVGMINMAHGATFAASGYAAWQVSLIAQPMINTWLGTGLDASLAMGATMVASGLVAGALFGGLIFMLAYLPIHEKANFAVRSLIVTLAINLATVQLLLYFFGPRQRALPKIFGLGRTEILGISVRNDQIGTIVATAILMLAVVIWLKRSRKGLEITAMMQNPEGAVLSGISVRWTALPVTMLTGALAGLAAILLSQTVFVSPTAGALPLIKGLTIALLGGLGSIPGAIMGAILIGFLEAIVGSISFLGQRYVLFSQFLFIITVLIIRPRGLGGLLDETRESRNV
jgi:branched-chain amino acid transport system permease protein